MMLRFLGACAAFCMSVTSVLASPIPSAGVFVFSTLCIGNDDSGGYKIVLLRGFEGSVAIFTRTEGPVLAPIMAYGPNVTIDESTGHISMRFVDPEFGNEGNYQFEGTVSNEQLDVTATGYIGRLQLPRILNFSKTPRVCK